ncbi:hypothetical protein FOMPIDRAFT_1056676 [Fomitopsis schrenkii]|uniref:Uncharacterized protein n=1 Tax=Fomitopsis schrenkii TaxID=2126942 RepID=S8DGF0_FOMSC|nr:hypothetical protein FOMPIDRAFT_1056676 [Fomitopsis schrenkii]
MPRFAVRELPGGNGRAVAVEATSCSSTRVYARLAETASGPSGPHFPDRQREKGVQTGALKVDGETSLDTISGRGQLPHYRPG